MFSFVSMHLRLKRYVSFSYFLSKLKSLSNTGLISRFLVTNLRWVFLFILIWCLQDLFWSGLIGFHGSVVVWLCWWWFLTDLDFWQWLWVVVLVLDLLVVVGWFFLVDSGCGLWCFFLVVGCIILL